MRRECPDRFAAQELDVLSPSAILAMGNDAAEAVRRVGAVERTESTPVYSRGVMRRGDRTIDVFFLPHPSARGGLWRRGQDAHVASLRAIPCGRDNAPQR
jgi:uracil-DNA glycosylase